MLARPSRPLVVIRRRPWRRLVAVVRGLKGRGWRDWEIASRLRVSRRHVRRALSDGAGIWSTTELARMRTAMAREMER